jgi:glycosyltransferase involved in cell wall biosynthesis
MPPIVVQPEVHAAGELRWLRRERHLSAQCESPLMRIAARAVLEGRNAAQRRGARSTNSFVAPSEASARDIERDYGISPESVHVVPNPIDLDRFSPVRERPRSGRATRAPLCLTHGPS